ncbi:hypothetical protein NP493_2824g00003 [Ridgeia piscesae]|uniref:Uncharacterized protein n=1 Tax=Ridgeia piscesae TaxID=27915 RepID=A0AAD9JCA6_RIDPI|nr:hypothetical protein NP493_2824g00003 [Ridgeia piscesae]
MHGQSCSQSKSPTGHCPCMRQVWSRTSLSPKRPRDSPVTVMSSTLPQQTPPVSTLLM